MASDPNQDIKRNTVEARQGSTRPNMIYVLIAAVILVVVAFILVGTFVKH